MISKSLINQINNNVIFSDVITEKDKQMFIYYCNKHNIKNPEIRFKRLISNWINNHSNFKLDYNLLYKNFKETERWGCI